MTATRLLLIALLFCSSLSSRGQQWDFLTWHGAKVGGELIKDVGVSVEQQVRLEENSTRVDETFTEIGVEYDLPKGFDISAAYRFSWTQDQDKSFYNRHRYSIDVGYGKDFWKLKAKIRARFQHRPANYLINERLKPDDSPMFVRLKVSLEYDKLKDWTPGFAFESFVRLDNQNQNAWQKFRYRVYLDYDLPKRQEISLFYLLETDYSGLLPSFASVLGISYSFEWKRPKKKKKK